MNVNKIALMAVAVVSIGIFAIPGTVSLFAGQHAWYDLGPEGNQVPCKKCHADVYEEYAMSGVHGTLSGSDSSNVTGNDPDRACGACHRVNLTGYIFASGDGSASTPGKEAHAAAVIACMECHEFGQFYYPAAGGFNVSYLNGADTTCFNYTDDTHNGTYAAHNAFVAVAIDDTTLLDSNEACIACHTNIAVKMNWTHARSLEFDTGIGDPVTTDVAVHNWTMSDWTINGTANATVWGGIPPIKATIVIEPETINLQSKGTFSAFIALPAPYSITDINIDTVVCEGAPAVMGMVGDNKYIAMFGIEDLVGVEPGDAVTLTVTGKLVDGTPFEGRDTISVIA